jgi:membrane associated rhomboid family serine protease
MGLYDRDYGRFNDSQPRFGAGFETKPAWLIIIVVTVVAYFMDGILTGRQHEINRWLSVSNLTLTRPWLWWQWFTYGLAHDPKDIAHILFNMFALFIFGSTVEQKLGKAEFVRFYIVSIFAGGLLWSLRTALMMAQSPEIAEQIPPDTITGLVMGASGGVQAITILFCFFYPQATIYMMMVLPVKAWVMGIFFAAYNLYGAVMGQGNTAFDVHLAGIAFAALYYTQRWNLAFLAPTVLGEWKAKLFSRQAKLRIHDPDKKLVKEAREADRILQKIHEQGESSLTNSERKLLERYSRRMRNNRN